MHVGVFEEVVQGEELLEAHLALVVAFSDEVRLGVHLEGVARGEPLAALLALEGAAAGVRKQVFLQPLLAAEAARAVWAQHRLSLMVALVLTQQPWQREPFVAAAATVPTVAALQVFVEVPQQVGAPHEHGPHHPTLTARLGRAARLALVQTVAVGLVRGETC